MTTADLGLVAGFALLDTLSPTTLVTTLYVLLAGGTRTVSRLTAYLGTVAGFYFAVGVALMLGAQVVPSVVIDGLDVTPLRWGQLVLGVGMFAVSWVLPTTPSDRALRRREPSGGLLAMVGLGISTGLAEVAFALPYLGAVGVLTASGVGATTWAPILAAYNLVMVLPSILCAVGLGILGARARPRLERWRTSLAGMGREAAAWMVGIVGVWLAANAAGALDLLDTL